MHLYRPRQDLLTRGASRLACQFFLVWVHRLRPQGKVIKINNFLVIFLNYLNVYHRQSFDVQNCCVWLDLDYFSVYFRISCARLTIQLR